ncbi:E3 ubiquitin-protein ligase MARCH6 [Fistulifera solaris]|uniref:RING-type E3 ubiquitin transferase n=1 Tax=Fistulifera solaris TaxID=1519565 RepID=A0A1Z5JAR6_FISSO|nr:E3 ubiquitin-protein ligase MARCH6 [Fistulifera solaris]|eukprot:GAX10851.1 E3 ubiquitin-protein ligase MARCH6 [Fistulifera solaris]
MDDPATQLHPLHEDDDEDECRVCRGPAEEGHPLYKPCRCSGSIGLTHQDCLQSWLQVQRGNNGTCELCHTPFRFTPLYAPSAPSRLFPTQVVYGVVRRLIIRWLPQLSRVSFAIVLWLVVTPWLTAYQYHGWMHYRPTELWVRSARIEDWASGLVVAASIIISFLSIMSFVDFLRIEWQQRGIAPWVPRPPAAVVPAPERVPPAEENIDNGVWEMVQQEILARPPRRLRQAAMRPVSHNDNESEEDEDDDSYDSLDEVPNHSEEEEDELNMPEFVREDEVIHNPPPELNNNNNNNNRLFDLDGDENMDVDINIALDELLGVRGPILTVVRNVLWLLAFNAVYLGFFCYIPRTVGMAIASGLFPRGNETQSEGDDGFWSIIREIDAESQRQESVFRLKDFVAIVMGYFACAAAAWSVRALWVAGQHVLGVMTSSGGLIADDTRETWEERMAAVEGHLGDEPAVALNVAVAVALDGMMAVVKVGVLLFAKMFLLPVMLGLCLDASVSSVLGCSWEERIAYAGSDLFSFVLLHWVMGITFMLLVTVSVLQLREVVHPDLLSQVIRPQEPQPDLLGNLLHETAATHAKRMAVSLLIYAALWAMHIYIPTQILKLPFLQPIVPSFRLKLFYLISPKIQVPFELIFFHLSMLGLLERYKNGLGEMQHHWLKVITGIMGIQDRVLPLRVHRFEYLGCREVFESEKTLVSFWYDLAKTDTKAEELIDAELSKFKVSHQGSTFRAPKAKADGQRVLPTSSDFIRLPVLLPGKSMRSRSILLPTKIGKYRLERKPGNQNEFFINLWIERTGSPIPRPPEGWDDLGADPPDVQGRWAYRSERKSDVEQSVACRQSFFQKNDKFSSKFAMTCKIVVMLLLSWMATTTLLSIIIFGPLFAGRLVYHILRVPDQWVHDPTAFLIGFLMTFTPTVMVARSVARIEHTLWKRLTSWARGFHFPPWGKSLVLVETLVLFFGLSPLLLGVAYDLAFLKSLDWFAGQERMIQWESLGASWATGGLLLYVWSFLCLRGVLTRRFRIMVVEGRAEEGEENPADARAAAWQTVGGRLRLTWQGEYGRMAQFLEILRAVMMNWEFDKVDKTVLLHYVAIPIFMGLSWILAIPMSFVFVSSSLWNLSPLIRAITTRLLLGSSLAWQILRIWSDQVAIWFEKVHASARDDLYLIGEVLQNFDES